jgi:hypothetical protein
MRPDVKVRPCSAVTAGESPHFGSFCSFVQQADLSHTGSCLLSLVQAALNLPSNTQLPQPALRPPQPLT